jgi:hypothetical protein
MTKRWVAAALLIGGCAAFSGCVVDEPYGHRERDRYYGHDDRYEHRDDQREREQRRDEEREHVERRDDRR